jgi:hypothetical protein
MPQISHTETIEELAARCVTLNEVNKVDSALQIKRHMIRRWGTKETKVQIERAYKIFDLMAPNNMGWEPANHRMTIYGARFEVKSRKKTSELIKLIKHANAVFNHQNFQYLSSLNRSSP